MQTKESHTIQTNNLGANIFKKMLDYKNAISAHLKKGGKLSDLKDKYKFAKPVFVKG